MELIEADKVQHAVQHLEHHDAQVVQRETVVENGQRVELGERGQTVQTADGGGRVVQRVAGLVFLKFHHSNAGAGRRPQGARDICD